MYDVVTALFDELDKADAIAKGISHKEYPAVIICWSYHDGMRDALFRITMGVARVSIQTGIT